MDESTKYIEIATESIEKKSIKGDEVPRTNDEHKSISKGNLKARFIAIAASATITGFALSALANNVSDKLSGSQYMHNMGSIVTENTHRTSDNSGYWYDTDDIAFSISESDTDKECLLYAVYTKLDYNRMKHMNDIMARLGSYDSEYEQYKNFEDYIIKRGFVKETGELDIEGYKKYMNEYVCTMSRVEEVKSEIGGKTR